MKPFLPVRRSILRFLATTVAALTLGAAPLAVAQDIVRPSPRFSVEVMGQGPDVIFLHGYASSREAWRPAAERLAGQYRVHLVQLSGFAGEPWTLDNAPVLQPALDDLAAYAATLDRPAFIGHSMGGLGGLIIAQKHPDRLSKVMSVDSLPFFGAMTNPAATVESVRPMADQMERVIRAAPEGMLRGQQQQTAVIMTLSEDRRDSIVEDSTRSDRGVLARALKELMLTDIRAGLPAMTTPVWAVYAVDNSGPQGAQSLQIWPREYAPLPNVRMEPVQNSRHFIMYDQAEALNALIDAFLVEGR